MQGSFRRWKNRKEAGFELCTLGLLCDTRLRCRCRLGVAADIKYNPSCRTIVVNQDVVCDRALAHNHSTMPHE